MAVSLDSLEERELRAGRAVHLSQPLVKPTRSISNSHDDPLTTQRVRAEQAERPDPNQPKRSQPRTVKDESTRSPLTH
jgi:hypothetical protein